MAQIAIDYDRGVEIKRIQDGGMYVYMYVDQPGYYFAFNGRELSEAVAEKAGFDVALNAKRRLKAEKLAAAYASIEAEDDDPTKHRVVETRNGYSLVSVGQGRYMIRDGEALLTPTALPEKPGKTLFEQLAGPKVSKSEGKAVSENGGSSA